jgi:hypothetical protein
MKSAERTMMSVGALNSGRASGLRDLLRCGERASARRNFQLWTKTKPPVTEQIAVLAIAVRGTWLAELSSKQYAFSRPRLLHSICVN